VGSAASVKGWSHGRPPRGIGKLSRWQQQSLTVGQAVDYDYAVSSGFIGTERDKSVREKVLHASITRTRSHLVTLNDDQSGTLKAH